MNNTYKFYLAFENSICPDYVTEKFFDIFKYRYNVIPVVYNGADMASIAPPHSYISVRDYSSVEHLAQYLSIVSSNDTLFASYFWWRDYYKVGPVSQLKDKLRTFQLSLFCICRLRIGCAKCVIIFTQMKERHKMWTSTNI